MKWWHILLVCYFIACLIHPPVFYWTVIGILGTVGPGGMLWGGGN